MRFQILNQLHINWDEIRNGKQNTNVANTIGDNEGQDSSLLQSEHDSRYITVHDGQSNGCLSGCLSLHAAAVAALS